jgi:hypothetical protein
VVAELELNSVIPPPVKNEEVEDSPWQSQREKPNPHYSTQCVEIAADFQRDLAVKKWSREFETRSVNQLLKLNGEPQKSK